LTRYLSQAASARDKRDLVIHAHLIIRHHDPCCDNIILQDKCVDMCSSPSPNSWCRHTRHLPCVHCGLYRRTAQGNNDELCRKRRRLRWPPSQCDSRLAQSNSAEMYRHDAERCGRGILSATYVRPNATTTRHVAMVTRITTAVFPMRLCAARGSSDWTRRGDEECDEHVCPLRH
jgi:hypothetical protein